MRVCALPEAYTVSHLSRWAVVPLLLLAILISALLPGGWLPVMGAQRKFVRRLKSKEDHMYLDGQQVHLLLLCFFNIIRAPVENIILCTAYTPARRYCTAVQVVHDSA